MDLYSGTPTQVKSRPSSGSPTQAGDLAVEERHPGGAGAERVGGQVQPALDEARGELGLAVLAVVERAHVGRADHDERGVARRGPGRGDAVELAPQLAGADRRGESGQR